MEIMVTKVTLTSGKSVLVKEATVEDMEVATQIAGKIAGDNKAHLGMVIQKELLKRLIVQIDEKILGMSDKERITSMFSLKEYGQISGVVGEIAGMDDSEGKPQTELVTFGDK